MAANPRTWADSEVDTKLKPLNILRRTIRISAVPSWDLLPPNDLRVSHFVLIQNDSFSSLLFLVIGQNDVKRSVTPPNALPAEFRSCVKVEVAVLGSPS